MGVVPISPYLTQVSNAPLSKYTTINTLTGEIVSNKVIEDHLTMLTTVVNEVGPVFLRECWTENTLDMLEQNVDASGVKLPSTANAASDRLGLRPLMPVVHLSSRVERFVKSLVISQLRSQVARRVIYRSILAGEPIPEYPSELYKNVQRATKNYLQKHETLPVLYTEFCNPRYPMNLLRWGSVDGAYAKGLYDHITHSYIMSMNVNKVWYSLVFVLPEHLHGLKITKVCLPNVRATQSGYKFDVCIEHDVPNPIIPIQEKLTHHKPLTVMGIDLGHTNTAVCSIVSTDTRGNITYHENSYTYDDLGQRDKLDRLRTEGYHIRKKRRAYDALDDHLDKALVLSREHTFVETKRANLGKELAYDLAQYVLSLCKIFGVDAVSMEDLRFTSNTEKSPSKKLNIANSTWSHSQIAGVLQQVLNKAGILLLHVNARNTSKACPSCDTELTRNNYHVTKCDCGITMERDKAASISIAKRGLLSLSNKKTKLPKDTVRTRPRLLQIPKTGMHKVKPSRDKNKPTPVQVNTKFYNRRKYPLKPTTYPLLQGRNGVSYRGQQTVVPRLAVVIPTYEIIVDNVVIIQKI